MERCDFVTNNNPYARASLPPAEGSGKRVDVLFRSAIPKLKTYSAMKTANLAPLDSRRRLNSTISASTAQVAAAQLRSTAAGEQVRGVGARGKGGDTHT